MRQIILEFIGGAWDGMNLCTCSPDLVEAELARYVLKMTGNGIAGNTVNMPRDYAVGNTGGCSYVVTAHAEVENDSLVRLECRGDDHPEIQAVEQRTIILRFDGGCQEGRILRSDSADVREALLTVACYHITDQGHSISEVLQVPPVFCQRCQPRTECRGYRAAKRTEDEGFVTVTLKFLGDADHRV
jgi:hypothetical protein